MLDHHPRRTALPPTGRVAQLAEHSALNRQVVGSIPTASTRFHPPSTSVQHSFRLGASVGQLDVMDIFVSPQSLDIRCFWLEYESSSKRLLDLVGVFDPGFDLRVAAAEKRLIAAGLDGLDREVILATAPNGARPSSVLHEEVG